MSHVILIHWNAGEAEERAALLRRSGHRASPLVPRNWKSLRPFRENPPDLFVIDLSRLPSQGLSIATLLRQQKGTRPVPIVFVGGERENVARVRELLPDATYTDWDRIRSAVRRAVRRPPAGPVLPGMMAAYSGTPLPKKLGIKAGGSVALLGAPAGFEQKISPLPEGVRIGRQSRGQPDLIILFASRAPTSSGDSRPWHAR